jgi:opacity protein-like surface antigen
MKKVILAIGIVSVVAAMASAADVTPNLDQGTKEMRLYGMYDNNTPLNYQLDLLFGFGYFVRDNIEVGGVLGYQVNDLASTYELGAVGEYNFDLDSSWVPFLLGGLLWAGTEADDKVFNDPHDIDAEAFVGRLGGGVKYFIRDSLAISLQLNYDLASEGLYPDEDGNLDKDSVKTRLGLRFYWD